MTIAEKITRAKNDLDEVYTAGYEKGKAEVIPSGDYAQGFEAGKQAEYDAFWDAYQDGGKRTDYAFAYAGLYWDKKTTKPKHDMFVTYAFEMFRSAGDMDLTTLDVILDFSNCTSFSNFMHSSLITHIGIISTVMAKDLSYSFYNCQELHTIDGLILKNDGSQTFTTTFSRCDILANITIEGTIGKSISFADSPLAADSAISVITHLKNFYGASDAYSQTLTFSASTWAALDALGASSPANNTWRNYVETELAWNT